MISDSYLPVKLAGNDVTQDFSFGFPIIAAANIRVYFEVIATGVQTLQTTGFTLTFDDSTPGGTVSFTVAPASTVYVIIGREIPKTQTVPYKTSSGFQGGVVESSLDKLTAIVQDNAEKLGRAIAIPLGSSATTRELPAPSASKIIGWNAGGTALENKDAIDASTVTAAQAARDAAIIAETGAQAAQSAAEIAAAAAQAVAGVTIASQAEAEAGVDNTKLMTPLRTAQGIAALTPASAVVTYSGASVFSSTAPTTYTDLDLSAVVGANRFLVFLYVKKAASGINGVSYAFRPKGNADEVGNDGSTVGATRFGVGTGGCTLQNGYAATILVMTDANGFIQWKEASSAGSQSTSIQLLAYTVLQ